MHYRETNNVSRKDFFQLLVQLRNTGTVQMDGEWDTKIVHDESEKKLTINEVAAHSFIFFAAGFETTSTTISFCLYEFAKHLECQRKAQQEIEEILKDNNGQITYESIQQMKYLESCIDETLRLHPPVPSLLRECTKDWTVPGTDRVIDAGTMVFIPTYAMHLDEQYFQDPHEFIPDRFNEQNYGGKTFIDMPYMPFGDGPRACIGLRFAKMNTKASLAMLLKNYNFELTGNTLNALIISPKSFLVSPEGGIQLKITKRML